MNIVCKNTDPEDKKKIRQIVLLKTLVIFLGSLVCFGTAKVSTSNHFPDDMRSKKIQQSTHS